MVDDFLGKIWLLLWENSQVQCLDSEGSSSIPIRDPALLPFSLAAEGVEGTASLI